MNKPLSLSPAEALHANVAVPFESAFAMPKSVYTSPEFVALEQKHVFAADWLCAGRAESLPNPGDYLTMDIAGEPIVVSAALGTVAGDVVLRGRRGQEPWEARLPLTADAVEPGVGVVWARVIL